MAYFKKWFLNKARPYDSPMRSVVRLDRIA